jgi:hypothetical protein
MSLSGGVRAPARGGGPLAVAEARITYARPLEDGKDVMTIEIGDRAASGSANRRVPFFCGDKTRQRGSSLKSAPMAVRQAFYEGG